MKAGDEETEGIYRGEASLDERQGVDERPVADDQEDAAVSEGTDALPDAPESSRGLHEKVQGKGRQTVQG